MFIIKWVSALALLVAVAANAYAQQGSAGEAGELDVIALAFAALGVVAFLALRRRRP